MNTKRALTALLFLTASLLPASTITITFSEVGFVPDSTPLINSTPFEFVVNSNENAAVMFTAASIEWIEIDGVQVMGAVAANAVNGYSLIVPIPYPGIPDDGQSLLISVLTAQSNPEVGGWASPVVLTTPVDPDPPATPEPATWLLIGCGLVVLAGVRYKLNRCPAYGNVSLSA